MNKSKARKRRILKRVKTRHNKILRARINKIRAWQVKKWVNKNYDFITNKISSVIGIPARLLNPEIMNVTTEGGQIFTVDISTQVKPDPREISVKIDTCLPEEGKPDWLECPDCGYVIDAIEKECLKYDFNCPRCGARKISEFKKKV